MEISGDCTNAKKKGTGRPALSGYEDDTDSIYRSSVDRRRQSSIALGGFDHGAW